MKINYNDFQSLVRNAPPDSGLTAQSIARSLEDKNYELPDEVSQYSSRTPKDNGFFSRLKSSIASSSERAQRSFGSEQVREGREEVSKGFDLADLPGDIADIIGPSLPIAGQIGGGFMGAGVAIPTGPGVIVAGAVGAAAGGGVLETGRREIGNILNVEERFGGREKTPFEDIKGIAGEGIKGGVGELIGGQLVARPLRFIGGRLLSPFAKHFDDSLARIAARRGVDLPASSTVDSPIVQLTEQVTGKGIFGGKLKTIVNDAEDKILGLADDIVKRFAGSDDLTLAGKNIDEGLQSYRSAWQKVKNKIYKEAATKIPATDRPATEATKKALAEVLPKSESVEKILGKSSATMLRNLQNSLNTRGLKQPSLADLMAVSDELGEILRSGTRDVQSTGSDAVLRKIAASIDDDIMAHLKKFTPEAYDIARRADDFYAEGIQSINSSLGKTINSLSDEPSKIATRAIRPKSPEQASRVIEMVISTEGGADRVANIQASFVRKLIDDATKNGSMSLRGKSFNNILNRYGDETLDAVLGQDARIALREVGQLSEGLGRAGNIADGSQTAFLGKVHAMIIAIGTGHLGIAAQIAGGDAILSKVFQSQIGRKWLTEGLTAPTVLEKFAPVGVATSKIVGREASDTVNPLRN